MKSQCDADGKVLDDAEKQAKTVCPPVPEKAVCRDEAMAKLKELVAQDKNKVLEHQFQLTAAKTALFLKSQLREEMFP